VPQAYPGRIVNPSALASAWPLIRLSLHLLVGVLLTLTLFRAVTGDPTTRPWVLAVAFLMAVVYVLGSLRAVRRSRGRGLAWLAVLVLVWVALMLLTPEGIWLAFPLFFLTAHLLTDRLAGVAVAGLAVAAIVGFGWHRHELSLGTVVGPVLGALVALVTVNGLRTVHRESERRGVLEERERLAREIHDTLAQGLSSIHLLLGAAEGTLGTDPAAAAGHIARARAVAGENLEEARRFVRALTPSDLADSSLPAAIARLVQKTNANGSLSVHLEVSGTPATLPSSYDVAFLRIAQAGVDNALAHADAGRVGLTLSYMESEIALDIVDDGQGFDLSALRTDGTHGFGLTAMRSRAEQLGGSFAVESAPGQGTAIAVTFPILARNGLPR